MKGFFKCKDCPAQYDGTNDHGHCLNAICQCGHEFGNHVGLGLGHPHRCLECEECREFKEMALNLKKCANCGEDLLEHPTGKWVHRYNMNEKCPNGTGVARLGPGDGEKGLGDMDFKEAKKELTGNKDSGKQKLPECDQTMNHSHDGEEKCACGHNWIQHSYHDCPRCGTKNCFGKAQQKRQDKAEGKGQGNGDGEQQQEQQTPPPEGLPEWMLKAGSDINDEWRKRIEKRDFMLTDEEAALTIYKHTDPDAASKVREADEEAEKNLGLAVLAAFNNRSMLPPGARIALQKVVQCTKCNKLAYETTAICPVAGSHNWGVIMPAPKPVPEEKQINLDHLKPAVLKYYPGSKLGAIKMVRENAGVGLKEAKDFVDKIFIEQSNLRLSRL